MATIVQTDSGRWKAVIRKTGWPATAKTFRLKKDAENWGRTTEDEMVRGIYVPRSQSERTTLSDALKRYAAEVTPTKRPGTQKTESKRIEVLDKELGRYSLAAITPEVVAAYRDRRLSGQDRTPPKPRAANTVRLDIALLGHLYTIAIREWGLGLTYNPVALIRKPSPGPGRTRRLTKDEEERLCKAAKAHSNPMIHWMIVIAMETGMRSSEIKTLTRDQVDLVRRMVRLTETKNADSRSVPLSKVAVETFQAALNNPIRPIDSDLIFFGEPGRDGVRRRYAFTKVWTLIREKAGITNFKFHDLRHEAISRFVELGLSDQQVAAISGHRSMQMLKRYSHLRTEDLVTLLDERKAMA